MTALLQTFTSTGSKFFAHQEVMTKLRNGQGQPVVTHVMLTDVCNHSCAFCSVQARAGDSLPFDDVMAYLDILLKYGLKAVILSGGGNPILYKCKKTGTDFNNVVDAIHERGLEIGLITNGMAMTNFTTNWVNGVTNIRRSWKTVFPRTLDKLTWIRLSLAGLDHEERECFVPDIDRSKTTLGFSYVAHDLYYDSAESHHGKVSTPLDLVSAVAEKVWRFEDRIGNLTDQIGDYVEKYKPEYVRVLPNCLEPDYIPKRCEQLQEMANVINFRVDRETVFVQNKPPKAPNVCYLGYIHPVLNCDGYVYPCDSCVLNEAADHQFNKPWRVCHWSEIASIYEAPVRSLVNPKQICPGCVFSRSNEILEGVRDGSIDPAPPEVTPVHANFV